jgi:hypothetical protein
LSCDYKRKQEIEYKELDNMIITLNELLHLQKLNYEPYKERQTKIAIRALLNIRGFKSIKSVIGDKN